MARSSFKYHPFIDKYLDGIDNGTIRSSQEMKLHVRLVRKLLDEPYARIDTEKIDEAVRLVETYFGQTLVDWERYIFALIHVIDTRDDSPLFSIFFIEMGRGNGKNGFISMVTWYLTTPNHGIREYNVDIVANSQDQAETSFQDIYNLIDYDPTGKLKKMYSRTKVKIVNKLTNSYIRYNTSNARTKDGKRSACLVFDEIHEYEDYSLINVFRSAFGKKKHSRIFYITTNGHVRGGVLDQELEKHRRLLEGEIPFTGTLPLIYKLDRREEADDEANWVKANPSVNAFPELKKEIRRNLVELPTSESLAIEFFTKRMNLPAQDAYTAVAPEEFIAATNRPIPWDALQGAPCIGAVDYAAVNDFASVGLLFRHDNIFYLHEHTFVCHKVLENRSRQIKFPVRAMAQRGLITIVNDEIISPDHIADWFLQEAQRFAIMDIRADQFKAQLLRTTFLNAGLPLKTVRSGPYTHTNLAPVLDVLFAEKRLVFGDNPTMRWYCHNIKKEIDSRGNVSFLKIEPRLRKTDGFSMLLHALTGEESLPQSGMPDFQFHVI